MTSKLFLLFQKLFILYTGLGSAEFSSIPYQLIYTPQYSSISHLSPQSSSVTGANLLTLGTRGHLVSAALAALELLGRRILVGWMVRDDDAHTSTYEAQITLAIWQLMAAQTILAKLAPTF